MNWKECGRRWYWRNLRYCGLRKTMKNLRICEIWCAHGGDYEEYHLLGCGTDSITCQEKALLSVRIVGGLVKIRIGDLLNKIRSVATWENFFRNSVILWYIQ
jgi:hypothetical protein